VRRGELPVLLARLPALADADRPVGAPFTDRLVVKFGLPVAGWRGRGGPAHGSPARQEAARRQAVQRQANEEPSGHA
jgi:hypothetical protein